MLSILIPNYNFNVSTFVTDLHQQASQTNVDFEIIIIDDASKILFKENKNLNNLSNVKYILNNQNLGRSQNRNKLAELARFDYLLFIDCDAAIKDHNFIKNYIAHCKENVVVCGGTAYYNDPPKDKSLYLRWWYGKNREERSANERNKNPNSAFSTFNFLIAKLTFELIGFKILEKGYGHEDTLFGYELKKQGIAINHIDNQLIHLGLDDTDTFLKKTEQGIFNLKYIYKEFKNDSDFIQDITLLRFYNVLKKARLTFLIMLPFFLLKNKIRKSILLGNKNLILFDFYKLGYFLFVK